MSDLILQPGICDDDPLAVCIMGPTATGKTELAMRLCDRFALDIISVDSALVYRGMDIGSAKPDARTLARYPHRLVDICDPAEAYSAGRFREDALREMADIEACGRTPLLVGGTMLYFKSLQEGIARLPAADPVIRRRLEAQARRIGREAMHARLAEVDPESAARLHPNDPQRVQRALEVHEITGKTMVDFWREQTAQRLPWRLLKIALIPPDRIELRKRIERRFDEMLKAGLIDEVERLYRRKDLRRDLPALRAVGYRQIWAWLDGEYDYPTMREKVVIATAQLAKRQMTWLRKEQNCNFFAPGEPNMANLLKKFRFLL